MVVDDQFVAPVTKILNLVAANLFSPLMGNIVWGVKRGVGRFLTMEFVSRTS